MALDVQEAEIERVSNAVGSVPVTRRALLSLFVFFALFSGIPHPCFSSLLPAPITTDDWEVML
jgi:hypothetical protein